MSTENRSQALPVRGAKIACRGLDKTATDEVRSLAVSAGYQFVPTLAGADLVVLGKDADPSVRQMVTKAGAMAVDRDEFAGLLQALSADGAAPVADAPRRSAFEVTPEGVRILDVVVPWSAGAGAWVPPAARFAHLCLDRPFLAAARAVALAAKHGLSATFEGETATSKSTVVLWVAHLLRQPIVRLNLNGQTDTSELVGRYVPAGDYGAWDLEQMAAQGDILEPETRIVVARALADRRQLTWVERTAIAANEKIPLVTWKFWEGFIPQALRSGWWVVLDEMNLAEPQVLERLNPVLEDPPTLVLTESDGTTFGSGGQVGVHPAFRLFGTMNPAEYVGRNTLSPAFRDRWGLWTFVDPPSEADLLAMLRCVVLGEQPDVPYRGVIYKADPVAPVFGALGAAPDVTGWLERIAVFHSSVARAAGASNTGATLGRVRRERYVFTRRTLLSALKMLHREAMSPPEGGFGALVRDVFERVYLDRVQDSADRAAVLSAMRAAGLGS